jgi:hypothetical protein
MCLILVPFRFDLYIVGNAGHSSQLLYRRLGEDLLILPFHTNTALESYLTVLYGHLNPVTRNSDMPLKLMHNIPCNFRIGFESRRV